MWLSAAVAAAALTFFIGWAYGFHRAGPQKVPEPPEEMTLEEITRRIR